MCAALSPAEAGARRRRLERALGQRRIERREVVRARSDVVRCIRVKQRGEVLDLPAAYAELELSPAVDADSALGAIVVRLKQPLQGSEAGRLDVDRQRREKKRPHVGDPGGRGLPPG